MNETIKILIIIFFFHSNLDTNFHIDYIAAVANLRARMYSIPEAERLQIKAIAGRIMPAIATTTGAVSGNKKKKRKKKKNWKRKNWKKLEMKFIFYYYFYSLSNLLFFIH